MKTIEIPAQFTYRSLLGHGGLVSLACRAAWLAFLVLLAFSFYDSSAEAAYGYRKSITINAGKVSGSQTNFPVLVSIPANAGMKTAANGGHVQNSNGYDIVFRAADGSTQLAHEVERYFATTGEMIAWVKVPAISSSGNTTIYVYYGDSSVSSSQQNASAVWDSNYKGVWHLNTNFNDSTSNANNGSNSGSTDTSGQIADARKFNGTDSYISVHNSGSLQLTSGLTIEGWVKLSSFGSGSNVDPIIRKGEGTPNNYELCIANSKLSLQLDENDTAGLFGSTNLSTGTWYYVVGAWDGTTRRLYVNGVQDVSGSKSGSIGTDTRSLYIGGRSGATDVSKGIVDEVRLSNVARSADWIKTSYNNQNSPSTFHTVGSEENVGGPVYHQITALAGTFGSISPAGISMVENDKKIVYTVVANTGYKVSQVLVDGQPVTLDEHAQYILEHVKADHTISVTFNAVSSGTTPPTGTINVPGCSTNINVSYGTSGFVASDFDLTSVDVTTQNTLLLNTGYYAIDPNKIVIPFTQEVYATFFYEGAGYDKNDFGWILASDGKDAVHDATKRHEIYRNINDNNNNGILDDREGNGVDATANTVDLGTFQAGTEIVFYMHINSDDYNDNNYVYTKKDWNPDTYNNTGGECTANTFTKKIWLGQNMVTEGTCKLESAWMPSDAVTRLKNTWGLDFKDAYQTMTITHGQKFPHVVVGVPLDKPNEWALGWEDLLGGGDTDLNDMIFHIERRTGGLASLDKPITPDDAEAYYTGVTATLFDYMPCTGVTNIKYYVSIDKGANWVEITNWDEIWESNASKALVSKLASWTPGTPAYTMKKARIDFAGRGLTGRELVWKADFLSNQQGCEPQVLDVVLDADVASHGTFSRNSPVTKANVVYSGYYETPASSWRDKSLRGHLLATRLYDPSDPTQTSTQDLWEAGAVLAARNPASRVIYFPNIAIGQVSAEQAGIGDGTARAFTGKLASTPISATTLKITDGRETFIDKHTDVLEGSLGGTGTINRFTGEFSLTFANVPQNGAIIQASYQNYKASSDLLPFSASYIHKATFGLDDSYIIPTGYVFDFDHDNDVDDDDAYWLMNWVRGYELGTSTPREWLLGPIDHSTPALLTVPGQPLWYFGTATTKAEQQSFDKFADAHSTRRSVIFAGSRSGMLHAFDAGAFRYGDNTCTTVKENRGYFQWTSTCPPIPATPDPDYGTGDELWAFIPANLLPRLKNNLLAKLNQERTSDYDQAYVDASPALADVFINGSWHTVVLSAEGNGGDTVFCLDVTEPSSPKFMWEFSDPDLFRSRSSPSIAKIGRIIRNGKTKWVAFFVSGTDDRYDSTQYPSVYMIDIEAGSVLERIFLTAAGSAGIGGVPSGQPAIVDSDGNGYIDRFYIGTDKGFMYKVNIPDDPDTVKFDISQCVINRDYSDSEGNEVQLDWHYQPIYGSPVVSVNNTVNSDFSLNYDVSIFFGTGDSPYYKDDINTTNTRYHFYAYKDTAAKGVCNESLSSLDWFYELPEGERVFASAFAAAGTIYFGTSAADTEDPCEGDSLSHNNGELFAIDMKNPERVDGKVVPKLQQKVGNMVSPPVVYDQHLFYKSFDGSTRPEALGGASWNTETITVPNGVEVKMWREVF